MDAAAWGWCGAALLMAAGYGWGRQVSREGMTGPWLAAMLVASLAGLYLVGRAALAGSDLPAALGLTSAVVTSLLSVYRPD